jgi:membrane protein implicated in regulation of membrane protease activity
MKILFNFVLWILLLILLVGICLLLYKYYDTSLSGQIFACICVLAIILGSHYIKRISENLADKFNH